MKMYLALSGFFIVVSCSNIYFIKPQPKGGELLTEIPKELFGTWFEDTQGFKLDKNGLTSINIEMDSIGVILDTTYQTTPLSDSFCIYKAQELYVFNYKDRSKYWEIVIMKPMEDGSINVYQTSDPEVFASAKGLKLKKANFYIDGEYKSLKTLKPLHGESDLRFESAVFSGQMSLKEIRKTLTSDHLIIWNKDGSIFNPNNTDEEINIQDE